MHIASCNTLGNVNAGKLEMVSSLYSEANLLRAPGHFPHLVAQIPFVVRCFLCIVDEEPPAHLVDEKLALLAASGHDIEDPFIRALVREVNGVWEDQETIWVYRTGQQDFDNVVDE
eukprot:8398664-Karenia_brevis.AAC.1